MIYAIGIVVVFVLLARWAFRTDPAVGYVDRGARIVELSNGTRVVIESPVSLGINTEDQSACMRLREHGFGGCMSCPGLQVCRRGRSQS
jgi:hypothetical protein